MLRIEVNKGGIERALKNYKSKVIRTKQLREVRDRKQFTKPSEIKRKQNYTWMFYPVYWLHSFYNRNESM